MKCILGLGSLGSKFCLKQKDVTMNVQAHLNALKVKHADLEVRISQEEHRPNPNQAAIGLLKKQKLKIKEELSHLAEA